MRLIVKNYRCFGSEFPLDISFDAGMTAFVGPNNSGKSSILKFFYELRNIFPLLSDTGNLSNLINSSNKGSQTVIGVPTSYDADAIFSDFNGDDIQISIEELPRDVIIAGKDSIKGIVLNLKRGSRFLTVSQLQFYEMGTMDRLPLGVARVSGSGLFFNGSQLEVDFSALFFAARILSNSIYIGAFRNALNNGEASHFDLEVGTQFINRFKQWRGGNEKASKTYVANTTEFIRKLFGFESFHITESADAKTLDVQINGKPYQLNELGSGISEFIVVLFNIAIKKPAIVLIDEPESHLHPAMQVGFLSAIQDFVGESILFSTHALGLARSVTENIFSVRKSGDHSIVEKLGDTPGLTEVMSEMSYRSMASMGYGKILFVEGVNDVIPMIHFLSLYGKDRSVAVFPLGGNALINRKRCEEFAQVRNICSDVYVVIDSEKSREDDPVSENHIQFVRLCKELKIPICVLEKRALENYLTGRAIHDAMGSEQYQQLGDYDKPDKQSFWGKQQNGKIAKLMQKSEIQETDLGKFIELI